MTSLARLLAAIGLAAGLAACAAPTPDKPAPAPPDKLVLTPASFASLPGWSEDAQAAALPALLRSCKAMAAQGQERRLGPPGSPIDDYAGTVGEWRPACVAAAELPPGDDAAARVFFESYFRPFKATNAGRGEGLFTGYYEAELHGSRDHGGSYVVPLLRRPDDLVEVDLGQFRPALKNERIVGRVVDKALRPYPSRQEIEAGALDGRALELLWVDDPGDAFFLQIQGSGRVTLEDGSVVRVGYDGQNGHAYVPVGRLLVERGILTREQVSMQSIRAWIKANPEEGRKLMWDNPSYVFFREVAGEGPIGAQGVPLTAERSIAVDRAYIPFSTPIWLDAVDEGAARARVRRLLIAQDTGGAIRGPVRGDVFWGHGAAAAERAGRMRATGEYYLLLPRPRPTS